MSNTATQLLRRQVTIAHDILEAAMADVTPEQAHWAPPGVANPLGATYAHVVVSENFVINGMFRRQAPLNATTWAAPGSASRCPHPRVRRGRSIPRGLARCGLTLRTCASIRARCTRKQTSTWRH